MNANSMVFLEQVHTNKKWRTFMSINNSNNIINRKNIGERSILLDSLRGIAALGVFVYHIFLFNVLPRPESKPFFYISDIGSFGVDLFYVLSGYFITNVVLCMPQWDPSRFWRARVTRIYPAYLGSLAIAIAIKLIISDYVIDYKQISIILLHIMMLHHLIYGVGGSLNGPCWTLGVEFPYYVLILAIGPMLRNYDNFLKISALLISVSVAWNIAVYNILMPINDISIVIYAQSQLFGALEMFLCGGIVAFLGTKSFILLRKTENILFAVCIVLLVLMMNFYVNHAGINWFSLPISIPFRLALALIFSAIIYFVARMKPAKWIRLTTLPWFGKISFSFYLYHSLCILVVTTLMPNAAWALKLAATTAASVTLGWMSWRYVEMRFHRFSPAPQSIWR